jgi:glycosyltransferase involved in cell wall biosynthesis
VSDPGRAAPAPLRVLHVIARMNVGGPASQVLAIAQGLERPRFRVEVLTGAPGTGEADFLELRAPTSDFHVLPGLGPEVSPLLDARALAGLDRFVRRYRPQVVHTHTAKAGLLGRIVARRQGIPTIHTFHGHLLHGYFGPRGTRAVVTTERWLARHTDRLVTVGARVRDELLAAGVGRPEQYVAMPPGVEALPVVDRAQARRQLGLAESALVLACVGRLTAVKRPDRLLEVAERVRAAGREVVVVLAGDGELREELEARATAAGLQARFLGWRADVETVYGAADLALLTSENEGMPVALIEAAMAGLPAVATDVGSVREVVAHGETGVVVPAHAAELASATLRLLDDAELRARMGEAARRRALARFSTGALVDATAELYGDVLSPPRGPRAG